MAKVPPSLLYLTIYNPSLRPIGPSHDGDEDAEEQAHILFYTARDRAVSRDRMLRQVGLAKALVNFSEMFNANEPCNNVHSQSRRMMMVSPEPGFWIHAAIELAKTPRSSAEQGKAKDRKQSKKKGKEKEQQPTLYDYHDASVNDLAVRSHILRGYETFKLTHGTFKYILDTLGQEALELQLERYFTVWAWSWNLEDSAGFSEQLGLLLHPLYPSILSFLDQFASNIPDMAAFVISPPYFIPSTKFIMNRYPTSLPRHIFSLIPPCRDNSPRRSPSEVTLRPELHEVIEELQKTVAGQPVSSESNPQSKANASSFLGLPPMNINMNTTIDAFKWTWPFGNKPADKVSHTVPMGAKEEKPRSVTPSGKEDNSKHGGDDESQNERKQSTGVDTSSLLDAMESAIGSVKNSPGSSLSASPTAGLSQDGGTLPSPRDSDDSSTLPSAVQKLSRLSLDVGREEAPPDVQKDMVVSGESPDSSTSNDVLENEISLAAVPPSLAIDASPVLSRAASLVLSVPAPTLSRVTVHLTDTNHERMGTHKTDILYLSDKGLTLALVDGRATQPHNITILPEDAAQFLQDFRKLLDEEENNRQRITETPITVSKLLQPKDHHVVAQNNFTTCSDGFEGRSEFVYNQKALLDRDPEITEIFSRGQNPQYWNIARKGLGTDNGGTTIDGEVYLEVSRKEASLPDVDNVLLGIIRHFNG